MTPANQVRGFRFMERIFRSQLGDTYCGKCSGFANTLTAVRDRLARFEVEQAVDIAALPPDLTAMLAAVRSGLSSIPVPAEPAGQKKAGNCKLPQGVCFIKTSYALIQQV